MMDNCAQQLSQHFVRDISHIKDDYHSANHACIKHDFVHKAIFVLENKSDKT